MQMFAHTHQTWLAKTDLIYSVERIVDGARRSSDKIYCILFQMQMQFEVAIRLDEIYEAVSLTFSSQTMSKRFTWMIHTQRHAHTTPGH